jgi:nucleotide-binding universal stress UspA family protein
MSIVVGYTPDPLGQVALDYAVAEADLRGTRVVVVNGTRGDAFVDTRYAGGGQVTLLEQELDRYAVDYVVRQTIGPDVAEQVLTVAAEEDATLIVVGIRHRSPVGKLLMGSVAQRILLDATCPVLAVKASEADG